jgi:flagellar protein FliL
MPDRTLEPTRGARGDAAAATNGAEAAPAAGASSAFKAWLPVLLTVVLMPVLAYVTTRYVLLPRVQHALLQQAAGGSAEPVAPEPSGDTSTPDGKVRKVTVPLSKVLVNVAGTMGTRYLIVSLTLVGAGVEFKNKIDENKDQLMDLATGALSTKTIADLEKPDARNLIRSELMNTFNNALGGPLIKEIYFTEWAIQ